MDVPRRRERPSRHGDGARSAGPRPFHRIMRTTRPRRSGPTATASCSRAATPRSSSTRCCTSCGYGLTLDDLEVPPARQQDPGHPEVAPHRRRRGHDRPARPGLRQRCRAWRSPSRGSGPRFGKEVSTTARSSSAPTATSWRASATRPHRSPATWAWVASSASTTTTSITIDGSTELALSDNAASGSGVRVARRGSR